MEARSAVFWACKVVLAMTRTEFGRAYIRPSSHFRKHKFYHLIAGNIVRTSHTHSWLPLSDRHTKSCNSGRSFRYAGGLPNCVCLNVPEASLFYLSFVDLLDSPSRTSVASRLLRQTLVSSRHRSYALQGASPRLLHPHVPRLLYVTWWLVIRVPNTLKSPYGHWPTWNRVLPVRSHSAAI